MQAAKPEKTGICERCRITAVLVKTDAGFVCFDVRACARRRRQQLLFGDIPQFTRSATYRVHVAWAALERTLQHAQEEDGLNIDPDFQRAHVWNERQQIRYVEFMLRGGQSGHDLLFNCPGWHRGGKVGYVLVDGKQRLNAALRFMRDEIPAFDHLRREYADEPRYVKCAFNWVVS